MPKNYSIKWEGDKVFGIAMNAVERAIDETTHETAIRMQADAPVDRGDLRDGIKNEPAERKGDVIEGQVGVEAEIYYATAVEANHPSKAGFMRRAADQEFPKVLKRLKDAVK